MRWKFPGWFAAVVLGMAGPCPVMSAAEEKAADETPPVAAPEPPSPKQPVSDNKLLPRSLVKPWLADGFVEYAGVYNALKGDDPGSSRLVFTAFVSIGGEEMLSVLRVTIPDLMAEPVYTVLGSVACDPKTGAVRGFGTSNKWRMVTWIDPNTGNPVHGVEVDGLLYADWNHISPGAKPVAAVKTPQQAGAPPPEATPIPGSKKEDKPPAVAVEAPESP